MGTSRNGPRQLRPRSRRTSSSWRRRTVTNLASWPSKKIPLVAMRAKLPARTIYTFYIANQPERGHYVLSAKLLLWKRALSRLIGMLKKHKEAQNPDRYNHHHHTTHD